MAAVAGQQLAGELTPVPPRVRTGAVRRFPYWRWIILILAGFYFALPLYAGFRFAGLSSFPAVASQEGFSEAFRLSLQLAAITTVLTLVLMVPTVVWVHLRLPKVRRIMETITILPIVIPPVVLILGVLEVSPAQLKASANLLALLYVVLAMPFAYRALDAGLRALDLKTLVEASNSLGGGMGTTLWRIILPNLRTALLSATVLTVALVLGEFTMASLDQYQTFPVWIVAFDQTSGPISVAASLAALIVTWIVLMLISMIGGRGPGGRGAGATLFSVARREPPGGS
jgi:putative spermidine/putrescine transport system permease protein